jgi:hypothetical protein
MAKYEVIARGIFVKEKGKIRELQLGEVITEPADHLMSKLRVMPELCSPGDFCIDIPAQAHHEVIEAIEQAGLKVKK